MRAVRLHGVRDLRVEDVPPPPAPGPGEVTLRVTAAGICGSDLHNYATGQWITRAPSIAGHELAGEIAAIGAGVRHVAVGDPVAVDSRVVCGDCAACRAGLGQICERLGFVGEVIDGGFAEMALLPAANVRAAPRGVAPRHLAMAEPLAVALHAVARLRLPAGAPVVVVGCGAIGALSALVAARAGHPVLLADRHATRAERTAAAVGGRTVALDALGPEAPRHAIDATGAPEVIAALIDGLRGGGAIALVGIGSRRLDLDPARLVEREMALVGCHAFGDELAAAVAMLADLAPALDALIDAEIPLEDVPAAYERHLAGAVVGAKTIILPPATPPRG